VTENSADDATPSYNTTESYNFASDGKTETITRTLVGYASLSKFSYRIERDTYSGDSSRTSIVFTADWLGNGTDHSAFTFESTGSFERGELAEALRNLAGDLDGAASETGRGPATDLD